MNRCRLQGPEFNNIRLSAEHGVLLQPTSQMNFDLRRVDVQEFAVPNTGLSVFNAFSFAS